MATVNTDEPADFLVIGGGMAGVSAAYYLSARHRVTVLERESALAYHTTGRSAALYSQTYGNAVIRGLTVASEAFYKAPASSYWPTPLLSPRGALQFAVESDLASLDAAYEEVRRLAPTVQRLDAAGVRDIVPVFADGTVAGAFFEPDAADMDVHAIHQGFVRGLRANGGTIVLNADVVALERTGQGWSVTTSAGTYKGERIVNAAGAWGDVIGSLAGARPVGLIPKRRTAILFAPPAGKDTHRWPLSVDINETFYFKPDAGNLLASPADETPSPPCDAQPEDIDVATVIDRIERATTLRIARPLHRWAGLRSFVPDKTPVVGYDPDIEHFFWLVGQGGYGIQTAPAMGELTAYLAQGHTVPTAWANLGVTEQALAPARFR